MYAAGRRTTIMTLLNNTIAMAIMRRWLVFKYKNLPTVGSASARFIVLGMALMSAAIKGEGR